MAGPAPVIGEATAAGTLLKSENDHRRPTGTGTYLPNAAAFSCALSFIFRLRFFVESSSAL